MVRNIKTFDLFDKNQTFKNCFRQRFDAKLEDVSVAGTIVESQTINLKTTVQPGEK